jgi:hypothetical protein
MDDRPNADELVRAVRQFLEVELIPALTDARLRFQTLVAAHALAIAERERAGEEERLREEYADLTGGLGVQPDRLDELRRAVARENAALCERIRAGEHDEPERFRAALALARRQVLRKLRVTNPKYLAAPSAPGGQPR